MTQAPAKFDLEAVARIVDHFAMTTSFDPESKAIARTKAAAIMALHDADPARQMADAEAALWREHDARHSAAAVRPVDEGEIADTISALEDLATYDENYAWRLNRRAADVLILAAAELSRLRADLADAVGVLENLLELARDEMPVTDWHELEAAAALLSRLKDAKP